MIMIFQSRIGIRKKKKGQQISPPENVFIPYLFSPAHLHIFHFLFSGISAALRGHRFGGTPEKPRRKRHQCWRVAEMMHLKI